MATGVSRRGFLGGGGGGAVAVLSTAAGGSVLASCSNGASADSQRRLRISFEGVHQQGIVTPAQQGEQRNFIQL